MTSVILLAFYLTFLQTQVATKTSYSFKVDHDLQNILFHGDNVYLGTTNMIYRMNANLVLLRRKSTGPVNETSNCLREKPCLRDNRNVVLLVYEEGSNSKLLSCGSERGGICNLRDLKTLNVHYRGYRIIGVERSNPDKVVSLITGGKEFLHVGVPGSGNDRHIGPYYTALKISDLTFRDFLKNKGSLKFIDGFIGNQVTMFSASRYVYVTTVQQIKPQSRSYQSRIVRYLDVALYESFTEIHLQCQDQSQNEYNVLVDGSFVNVSGQSASVFNASDGDSLFVGIFSKSAGKSQTDKNVVCIFTLKEVNRAFDKNIKLCVEEGVGVGLNWYNMKPGCKV